MTKPDRRTHTDLGDGNIEPTHVVEAAVESSRLIARAPLDSRNAVIDAMISKLDSNRDTIMQANMEDLDDAKRKGLPAHLVNRLRFGKEKIDSRIRSLGRIRALPDPVGSTIHHEITSNGLDYSRVRVPLGVILMIYEARPHVTVNAGAFCMKSGNAAILRGGSEARTCNALLGRLWRESLVEGDLPGEVIQVVSGNHEQIGELLQFDDGIDLVIPRGGKELIGAVCEKSRIPVIKHYEGICHVYIHSSADMDSAMSIALDSKCLMPEVCNAMETLLIDEERVENIPAIVGALLNNGVEVRGCERTRSVLPDLAEASEQDWRTEYLDMVLSIKVVAGVDEAIEHINTCGSHHTDSIVAQEVSAIDRFVNEVDSAVVLVNASTMFCDGESLGMGAEIGISTDRLHARGPMGLEELTTYKFVVRGEGQTMQEWK